MNQQCNTKRSRKSLNRSDSIKSMDMGTDNIIANLSLEDIKYIWLMMNARFETI